MKRWLGRLSFSFLIIGLVLAYEGYRIGTGQREGSATKARLYYAGAAVGVAMFLVGTRLRHAPDEPRSPDGP